MKLIKLIGFYTIVIANVINPINALAITTEVPVQANISSTPLDMTISDNMQVKCNEGTTAAEVSDLIITNNNKLGVLTLNKVELAPINNWKLSSYEENFNLKKIDSKEIALKYNNHDLTTPYITPQEIIPTQDLVISMIGKVAISSTNINNSHILNSMLTFEYVEEVYLDTLKVVYTEQPDSVTNINPDHLKVTAVYTDGTEKILSTSDYTLTPLTGNGEETVKVTYTEKGVTKEAVFIVNNPYTVTLISDGSTDQKISYKFGTGTTLPIPSREGYVFGGWYESRFSSGSPITKIDTTTKGNKTLYAKWTAINYKINYNLDGGSIFTEKIYTYSSFEQNSYDIIVDYGEIDLTNVSKIKFEAESYYTFEIYIYLDGTLYTHVPMNTEVILDDNMKKKATIKIDYPNEGEVVTPGLMAYTKTSSGEYTIGGKTLPIPTKDGYTFKGWYDSPVFEGNEITKIDSATIGDKTFYAKWEKLRTVVSQFNLGNTNPTDVIATLWDDGIMEFKGTQMKNGVSFDNPTKLLIKEVHFEETVTCNDITGLFQSCTNLEYVNRLPIGDNEDSISYQDLFKNCSSLKSSPDIAAASVKGGMFYGCSSLTGEINVYSPPSNDWSIPVYAQFLMFNSSDVYKPIKLNFTSQNKDLLINFCVNSNSNITLGYDLTNMMKFWVNNREYYTQENSTWADFLVTGKTNWVNTGTSIESTTIQDYTEMKTILQYKGINVLPTDMIKSEGNYDFELK